MQFLDDYAAIFTRSRNALLVPKLPDLDARCDPQPPFHQLARRRRQPMTMKAPIDFGDWPGGIVFGRGAVTQLGAVLGRVGGSRALVMCGSTVARTDMVGKVKAGLGDRIAAVFAEVKAHTPVEKVERGLAMFR